MSNNCSVISKNPCRVKFITGVILLFAGCAIYLLFRSQSIRLYVWCKALGLDGILDQARKSAGCVSLSDFVLYSLPDGLYCAAYILMTDAVWHNNKSLQRIATVSAIPLVAIVYELMQGLNMVSGTFDVVDILCYCVPLGIYILYAGKTFLSTD